MKNTIEENLLETIEMVITCSVCNTTVGGCGYEEILLAKEAAKKGWRVHHNGEVICPDCKILPVINKFHGLTKC